MGGYGPSGRPRRYAPRAPPVPGHVPGPIRSNNFYPELPQRRQYRNNQQSREEWQTVHRQGSVPDYCLSHRQPQHQQSREEGQPPINYNHIRGYGPMTRRPTAPPPNLHRPVQRRLLHNPFYALAHELGVEVKVAAKPRAVNHRCLAERHAILPESLGSNLWWILPASCITQIMWILLGVYLKRTCTKDLRGRKSETKAIPRR